MQVVKVISTSLKSAKRLIKFLRYGRADVKENMECSPYGLDSNPIKDTRAVYTQTTSASQSVVIGYVNTMQKADVGEFRTFATNANGVEVFYTWMKADGTMEIGGAADNMVRYSELEAAFNELKQDFNDFVTTKYNLHNHPTAAPGAPSVTVTVGTPSTADISGAKIDEIKTL